MKKIFRSIYLHYKRNSKINKFRLHHVNFIYWNIAYVTSRANTLDVDAPNDHFWSWADNWSGLLNSTEHLTQYKARNILIRLTPNKCLSQSETKISQKYIWIANKEKLENYIIWSTIYLWSLYNSEMEFGTGSTTSYK